MEKNMREEIYVAKETDIVAAEPMSNGEFYDKFPGRMEGPLIKVEGYKIRNSDGFFDWCSKSCMEECYRKLSAEELGLIIGVKTYKEGLEEK